MFEVVGQTEAHAKLQLYHLSATFWVLSLAVVSILVLRAALWGRLAE